MHEAEASKLPRVPVGHRNVESLVSHGAQLPTKLEPHFRFFNGFLVTEVDHVEKALPISLDLPEFRSSGKTNARAATRNNAQLASLCDVA